MGREVPGARSLHETSHQGNDDENVDDGNGGDVGDDGNGDEDDENENVTKVNESIFQHYCNGKYLLNAKVCKIDRSAEGGLSNYVYLIMVIFFLQKTMPPVLPVLQEVSEHQ